ncbi:MAG: acetyl-CoA carboxylase, biotin carboxyl carrier protein [bacterium]|nr:acetyl-CoA carboxylase, biotin carboxyl carrier protein [bacterium]
MSDADKKSESAEIVRIRELAELMTELDLTELDLREDESRITLKRGGVAQPALPAPVAAAPAAAAAAPKVDDGTYIQSPMVGTFYARPNPESEAFVKAGDFVTSETVVCIIEAMKTFNEIPAGISGRVLEVLIDNESPVDVGRKLYKIDTSATA